MSKPLNLGNNVSVRFAGEHTCLALQGYLHGALESGFRAAAEVLGTGYSGLCELTEMKYK